MPTPSPADIAAIVRKPQGQPTRPKVTSKSQTRTVTARVRDFNEVGGYGFAVITSGNGSNSGKSVFFHRANGRVVNGTVDKPELTTTHKEVRITSGRNADQLLMQIEQGPKGLRAVAWGKLPSRDWRADLVRSGLDCYIGGTVRSVSARSRRFPGKQYRGRLAAVDLSADKLTITLIYAEEYNQRGLLQPVHGGELELTYDLELARLDTEPQTRGGYAILVIEGNFDRRITFSLPGAEERG